METNGDSRTPRPDARALEEALAACAVEATGDPGGWSFLSRRDRFARFDVRSPLRAWHAGRADVPGETTAWFLEARVWLCFASGSVLVCYASGHIRWVPEAGLRYHALLGRGRRPDHTQGDLVVWELDTAGPIPSRDALAAMVPADTGTVWCRPSSAADPGALRGWLDADRLFVGGNSRHRAEGRMRFTCPVPPDSRTVQVQTVGEVVLSHDPVDEIHPTVRLPAGRCYLITKLPGFSDPAREAAPGSEVSP